MFQVDMTGYQPPHKKEVIGVATDFVDPKLSEFLRQLTKEYTDIDWANTKCGYVLILKKYCLFQYDFCNLFAFLYFVYPIIT